MIFSMKKTFYILPILLTALLSGCGEKDKAAQLEELKKQQSEIKQQIAALESELAKSGEGKKSDGKAVAITTMEPATFRHLIEVQAKVEGDDNVMVSPETMGTISRIMVKVGDKVSAGSWKILVGLQKKNQVNAKTTQTDLTHLKKKHVKEKGAGKKSNEMKSQKNK